VSAWTTLVPHLTDRFVVYLFPNPFEQYYYGESVGPYGALGGDVPDPDAVEWVIVRPGLYPGHDAVIDRLRRSGAFEVAIDEPPYLVLRRTVQLTSS
jgi:hypothetical protein